jgi:hypothetical protein
MRGIRGLGFMQGRKLPAPRPAAVAWNPQASRQRTRCCRHSQVETFRGDSHEEVALQGDDVSQEIVIDCPDCQVRVKTKRVGSVPGGDDEVFFLVQCPACRGAFFGRTAAFMNDRSHWELSVAERLWPAPLLAEIAPEIPERARRDIKDAQKALSHGIYSAAQVLCSRALIRLIKQKAGASMIASGFAELKSRGIIDQRLFDWAEILRKERHIGTQSSEEDISREDAEDLIDFTIAIFDYIYTVTEKYEKYVARRSPVVAKSG